MKKLFFTLTAIIGFSVCLAGELKAPALTTANSETSTATYSSLVNFPTGTFFNDKNFIYVQSTWVRIVIGGQGRELDIRNAETDTWGNYALTLTNGESITIYSNGKSLYYNGTTYTKK